MRKFLDQPQQILGIEARLQHDGAAVAERQHAIGIRRGVVHRPVHQHDLVVVGRDAVGQRRDAFGGGELFGAHLPAPHALRPPGGARGIEHRRHPTERARPWRMRIAPCIPVGHAIRHDGQLGRDVEGGCDLRRRRHDQHLDVGADAALNLRPEIGVAHQNAGAAIAEDVVHLLGLEMPVDRHHRRADGGGGAGHLEERKIVAQHHGDRRAAVRAQAPSIRWRPARRARTTPDR